VILRLLNQPGLILLKKNIVAFINFIKRLTSFRSILKLHQGPRHLSSFKYKNNQNTLCFLKDLLFGDFCSLCALLTFDNTPLKLTCLKLVDKVKYDFDRGKGPF
jgi:hypothetical protein